MIINTPKPEEFESLGIQCLCQAFDMIFKVKEGLDFYLSEIEHDNPPNEDCIWTINKGVIMTSLILLHQGMEALMKSEVTKDFPLRLIERFKDKRPTLPEKMDTNFDELLTISGEKLLRTYCDVVDSTKHNKKFIELFNDIRLKRNKYVHGVPNEIVSVKYLIENILNSFTYFFGKDKWVEKLRKVYIENPLFGYNDGDWENILLLKRLDFAKEIIGVGELSKHFSLNLKARKYYCPECNTNSLIKKYLSDSENSQWTFLVPNSPDSTTVKCLICQQEFKVERIDCQEDSCKGNVILETNSYFERICLTCLGEYDESL